MLTVGEILQTERIRKNLSLKDIEKKIKIREKFLYAVEQNDWKIFSSKIYISGIIRNYSAILGLNPEKMLAFFRREYARKEDIGFKKRISSKHLTPQTRRYYVILISFVSLLFCIYFGYEIYRYLSPPKVEILSPVDTSFRKENKIRVIGKTEKEAVITIFGDRIYQNKEGVFRYDFPLKTGKNILTIEVIGANGKKNIIRREFFLNPL